MIKYKVKTPPVSEPLELADVKEWLKVEHTVDDDLITALIVASRQSVEQYINRILFTTTIEQAFDGFPMYDYDKNPFAALRLAFGPLQSVVSVKYRAESGSLATLNASSYIVDDFAVPPCITPAYDATWPTAIHRINSVIVEYVAGKDDVTDIPEVIKLAMKKTIAEAYDKREDSVRKLPTQATWLLDQYRVKTY